MLLYIIEAAIPLLSILFIWAGVLALKGNFAKHKKIAISHAVATWISYIIVIVLVRMGFSIEGKAPEWLVTSHLIIIYLIPPALVGLLATGLKGKRKVHQGLALFYAITWGLALITGLMIFLSARGYI